MREREKATENNISITIALELIGEHFSRDLILFLFILDTFGDINLTLGMLNMEDNMSKVRKIEKSLFCIYFL